jgi:hypothetical protein
MAKAEGIPPTASVASVGLRLNYIGTDPQYCYAYSEMKQVSSSDVLHLDFTSGAGFITATFTALAAVLPGTLSDGVASMFKIEFNGLILATAKVDSLQEDMPTVVKFPLIIPPFTVVEINCESEGSTSNMKTSCQLTGRVYDV